MFGLTAFGYVVAPFGVGLVTVLFAAAAIVWVVPFVVLWKVSAARGQSRTYTLWGFLGIPGLIAGVLVMMAMLEAGNREPGQPR